MRRPHRNIEIFSMSALDLFASALGGFVLVAIMLFPYYNKYSVAQAEATAAIEAQQQAEAEKTAAEAAAEAAKLAEEAAKQAEEAARAAQETAESQLEQTQEERDAAKAAAEEAQRIAEVATQAEEEAEAKVAQLVEVAEQQQQEVDALRQQVAKTFLIVVIEWDENYDVDMAVTDPAGRTFSYDATNRTGSNFPGIATQLSVDNKRGPGIEVWQAPDAEPGRYQVAYKLFSRNGSDTTVTGKAFFRNGVIDLPSTLLVRGKDQFDFELEVTEAGSVELVP